MAQEVEMTNDGDSQKPYVYGPEDGPAHWFVNNRAIIKASASQTGGLFGLVEMRLPPGGHSPPLHVHNVEDESFWILEGELTVRCGDSTFKAGPGSFVYTPRGVPHAFKVEGDTPPRFLVLFVPGGGEGFFIDGGRPAEGPGLPPETPRDIERLQAAAAKYHQENIGPPLP
jgi:quercetin dioxygenase-like cupin family protein